MKQLLLQQTLGYRAKSASTKFPSFLLVLGLLLLPHSSATLYFNNRRFPSIPGTFGMPWQSGIVYKAHLQKPPSDLHPLLCSKDTTEGDRSTLQTTPNQVESGRLLRQLRSRRLEATTDEASNSTDPSSATTFVAPTDGLPVALLVSRGQCSFEEKARTAMAYSDAIQFVIVYDDRVRSQLVPMSATDPRDVTVGMLFVAHLSGLELHSYLLQQSDNTTQQGGLVVEMDSKLPLWPVGPDYQEEQQWMLAALAGFFTFLACFGCLLVCALAGYIPTDGRIVINGRTITTSTSRRRQSLLTPEQVELFPEEPYVCSGGEDQEESEENACAICIDEFTEGEMLRVLPCSHKFHTGCIVPWLTERSASCPLCKQDIAHPNEEEEEEEGVVIEPEESTGGTTSTDTTGTRPPTTTSRHWTLWSTFHRQRQPVPTVESAGSRSDDGEQQPERLPVVIGETA